MSKSLECNIVRNILPNYIDKLTDKDINKYIKKHLSTCAECRQIYEDMSGELDIEKQHRERNKRQIKRFNNKILRLVAIICSIIIIITIGIVIYENYMAKKKEQGYTLLKVNCISENELETIDGTVYVTMVFILDNENICVGARVVQKGYTKEYLEERNKIINSSEKKVITNYKIVDDEEHYNINIWNGQTKDEVVNYIYKFFKNITISET